VPPVSEAKDATTHTPHSIFPLQRRQRLALRGVEPRIADADGKLNQELAATA
jgi:hypothetical protein